MVIIFRKTSSKIILTGKGKEKKDKEKEGKERKEFKVCIYSDTVHDFAKAALCRQIESFPRVHGERGTDVLMY